MASDPQGNVTQILAAIASGERGRTDELMRLVYDELRLMARQKMARESPGLTLQPTALVHEAYLRLVGDPSARWEGRAHFFAAAAEAMRRILVERARRYAAPKHGGGRERVPLEGAADVAAEASVDVLVLDDALRRLEAQDERKAQVVKLRFFAGLTIEETANALDVTPRTVDRDWVAARAWLHRETDRLDGAGEGGG